MSIFIFNTLSGQKEHFEPSGPQTVTVGSKLTLDLKVNAGTNTITAAQSYLTFKLFFNSLLYQ